MNLLKINETLNIILQKFAVHKAYLVTSHVNSTQKLCKDVSVFTILCCPGDCLRCKLFHFWQRRGYIRICASSFLLVFYKKGKNKLKVVQVILTIQFLTNTLHHTCGSLVVLGIIQQFMIKRTFCEIRKQQALKKFCLVFIENSEKAKLI